MILVVGDIMLDKYTIGSVDRISPEAPVPVVKVKETYTSLGGAGNVVSNLRNMGIETICMASVGDDIWGDIILDRLRELGAISYVQKLSRQTTVKERILAETGLVQMLRVDREDTSCVDWLAAHIDRKPDIIVVSDYAKGMITEKLMDYLKSLDAKIIIDPKPKNQHMYRDSFLITPNLKEWLEMEYIPCEHVLVTKGASGMTLYSYGEVSDIPTTPVKVYNSSGCGDVVVAVMAACLSAGMPVLNAAQAANRCATYAATLPGTSVIPKDKFEEFLCG